MGQLRPRGLPPASVRQCRTQQASSRTLLLEQSPCRTRVPPVINPSSAPRELCDPGQVLSLSVPQFPHLQDVENENEPGSRSCGIRGSPACPFHPQCLTLCLAHGATGLLDDASPSPAASWLAGSCLPSPGLSFPVSRTGQ